MSSSSIELTLSYVTQRNSHAMVTTQPHFLLFSAAEWTRRAAGRWRFVLESIDGETTIEAADDEPGLRKERLELLAVVRGLEALDQPSRVTLVTSSQRVTRGFRSGLDEWRSHRWRWERDGRWTPIKNRDLWQRVDRALQYHRVECRTWRLDPAQAVKHSSSHPPRQTVPTVRHSPTARRIGWDWSRLRRRFVEAARPLVSWPSQRGHWGAAT
jgi:ribonuclease HI